MVAITAGIHQSFSAKIKYKAKDAKGKNKVRNNWNFVRLNKSRPNSEMEGRPLSFCFMLCKDSQILEEMSLRDGN
jgi:hypothetical protein